MNSFDCRCDLFIKSHLVKVRRSTEALFSPLAGWSGALNDERALNFTLDLGRFSGERNLDADDGVNF